MQSYKTRSKSGKKRKIIPDTSTLRDSPEAMDSDSFAEKNMSEAALGGLKNASAGIHHHIPPALGTPFLSADGLVHRGIMSIAPCLMVGHLMHRYADGTESPVPVELKSLGDGTVITRNLFFDSTNVEPTYDSSSDDSYTPDRTLADESESSTSAVQYDEKKGEYVVGEPTRKVVIKRRQSSHRKEFHNVLPLCVC
jgi:hypothetical protein